MNSIFSNDKRRLVPRWRSLSVTLQSRELGSPAKMNRTEQLSKGLQGDLLTKLEKWRISPSLVSAAELVEASIIEGRETEAVNAARRLVSVDRSAAPLIREQAAGLLVRTGHSDAVPPDLAIQVESQKVPRYYTRIHPRDALAWVELALHQTIGGSSDAAEKSMTVALNLAPNNRHVLRSAARLYLHQNDPERALATIARNAATPTDPWLMASEIALAQVTGRTSRYLKTGSNFLDNQSGAPRQITELAGALATEELVRGNRKKSKRWFGQSMVDPTGSALAQGEWAVKGLGSEVVTENRLITAFENAEAMAFHLFRLGKLDKVSLECERWSVNDPFSIRPFEFGTVAASYNDDFETALSFAEKGLKLRRDSVVLLNALAFSAASLGKIGTAFEALSKIKFEQADVPQKLVALANYGLLAFRTGDDEGGRKYYLDAIEGFRRQGLNELSARARLYLAREALAFGTSDGEALFKSAKEAMAKFPQSDATIVMNRLELSSKALLEKAIGAPSKIASKPEAVNGGITVNVKFNMN